MRRIIVGFLSSTTLGVLLAGCGAVATPAAPTTEPVHTFGVITANSSAASSFADCLAGTSSSGCFAGASVHSSSVGVGATVAPGPPTNVAASSSGTTVTLTWNTPSSGDPTTTYIIEAGSAPGLVNLASFPTGNTLTVFQASGVAGGTYYVRIRAVNAGGVSAPSNDAILTVEGTGPCVAPAAPTGLAATFNVGGVVSLTWNGPTGSPTTYFIEAGSLPGLINLANSDLGGPGTSMTTTNVAAGTYYVRVRARNACGISAPSNEIVLVVRPATPFPTATPTPTPTCTVTLSPTGASGMGADAGGGGINVSSPVGCAWTATSNVPWLTIHRTTNTTGGPQGAVYFDFTANTTGASRTGTLTIGGQTFTFQQNGFSCSQSNASLSPTSASFTAAGGTGSIMVTYTAGCAWDVLPIIDPASAWVTIASPGVRTGSSTVTYTVAPNSGGSRRVFFGFVGKNIEVYQEGPGR